MEDMYKRMVRAFLHDPPCKPLDFSNVHIEIAENFLKTCWVDKPDGAENLMNDNDEDHNKFDNPDHAASAADRMIFPKGKAATKFSGVFKHPLSGVELKNLHVPELGRAIEHLQNAFGGIHADSWKDFFFLLWRQWRENAVELSRDMMFYPAETRLPDHSIWLHMDMTAAFEACRNFKNGKLEPALLMFQVGPVQEFIASAKSTRDLWSGSYLIAWLTAHALRSVSDACGPCAVIFPGLRGQGIFDAVNKDIFAKIEYKNGEAGEFESLWQRLYNSDDKVQHLLNPTIPNRFMALVPESRASEIACQAEKAVIDELHNISESCFKAFADITGDDLGRWQSRWEKQIDQFPQITWQTLPFHKDIDTALTSLKDHPQSVILDTIQKIATEYIPDNERDSRNYSDDAKSKLNRSEFAWAINVTEASRALAARRNTREFNQFETDKNQDGSPKDKLSGKEEIIGDEALWDEARKSRVFKDNEGPYGAVNIIKRLWCRSESNYLFKRLDIKEKAFGDALRYESVEDITQNNQYGSSYIAIITMDGDQMGKWMSGEKAPVLLEQMSDEAKKYFHELFMKNKVDPSLKRPLSPAYHLQFSEALANFANFVVDTVVRYFKGQLIYAGGDDVLAMLPADQALMCARSLRGLFRGESVKTIFPESFSRGSGFVNIGEKHTLMVPGPNADVSCGIAIAYKKYPLQKIIEESRKAEKIAKSSYNRSALALSIIKHGGETLRWGAKWDSKAWDIYDKFIELSQLPDGLSGRFPNVLAQLLAPYELEKINDRAKAQELLSIMEAEFAHVMEKQGGKNYSEAFKMVPEYLEELANGFDDTEPRPFLGDFVTMFLVATFLTRKKI
jgi:CRISPR-associated protein Cmr2